MTLLYFNLRIAKEGMNQQVLSRDLRPKDYDGIPLLDHDDDEEVGYKMADGHVVKSNPASQDDDVL